jgi:hypothetical protein
MENEVGDGIGYSRRRRRVEGVPTVAGGQPSLLIASSKEDMAAVKELLGIVVVALFAASRMFFLSVFFGGLN